MDWLTLLLRYNLRYDCLWYQNAVRKILRLCFTCIQSSYAHYTYIWYILFIYFCERFKSYIITNCECTINNRCVSKNTRQIIKKINLIIQPDRFCSCDVLNFLLSIYVFPYYLQIFAITRSSYKCDLRLFQIDFILFTWYSKIYIWNDFISFFLLTLISFLICCTEIQCIHSMYKLMTNK